MDHRRLQLLRLSRPPMNRTAAPVVLSCFKRPLLVKKLGFLVWNDTQRKQSRIKQLLRHSDELEVSDSVDLLKG